MQIGNRPRATSTCPTPHDSTTPMTAHSPPDMSAHIASSARPTPTAAEQLHGHRLGLPLGPLLGMAALVLCTVLVVAAVRLAGGEVSSASTAPVTVERQLRFEDRSDGGIVVLDAAPQTAESAVLTIIAPGGDGFLRGTLRALVRSRRLAGAGPEMPFHLAAHADGRLTLTDPATGQRVDLESFGPTNAAVFAHLLTASRPARALPR